MRGRKKSGIIELGRRSILSFFFEHPMATYSAALAYRGLFGLFPFLLILVVLVGALGFTDYLDKAMDHASTQPYQHVPQQLEPVVEPAREQVQPLVGMLERAEKRAGGDLLIFGVGLALWSVSAVARTLTEAFNVAYQVDETRRWWKQLLLSLAFGPILALVVLVSVALMLIGPQLVGAVAELVDLDELFVGCGAGCAFPWPYSCLPWCSPWSTVSAPTPGSASGRWSRARCSAWCCGRSPRWLFLLPGNLRQLRSHLREHWRRRGFAVLPLSVRFGGVVRRRAKRRDLPPGHERQRKGTKQMGSGSKEDASMSNESRYQQRLSTFAANWRALALRGLVALLFGLVVLFWPGLVLTVLALLFGIYAAVDGAITFVPALRSPDRGAQRSLPLAEGAVGIVAGLVAILWPGLTTSGLVYVIAGWALLTGVLKILTAILLRAEVENGWLLAGSGVLSALFGILLVVLARSDVPFLAPFIGGFAVVVGLALIVFAFRLRERR